MAGSHITRDVCEELGIESIRLDLKQGFDALEMKFENEFDLVFLHPPYWNIIKYSSDPGDLSNVKTYEEFLKLQTLLNLSVKALEEGGHIALLIGDFRRNGTYTCIARDIKDPPRSKFI